MNDFNGLVEAEIERHARQWEKTEERLCNEIEKKRERIRELALKTAVTAEDAPWFIKDFNVLYRAALRVAEACEGRGEDEGRPYPALNALKAQLERLRPAYTGTEVIRKEPGGQ
jgi:hypothetical protein